eukprot:Sspe_Gene.107703::Locus_86050_Transcript_1_1_Confidence_1.000_Length_515::g.107703::m.107703
MKRPPKPHTSGLVARLGGGRRLIAVSTAMLVAAVLVFTTFVTEGETIALGVRCEDLSLLSTVPGELGVARGTSGASYPAVLGPAKRLLPLASAQHWHPMSRNDLRTAVAVERLVAFTYLTKESIALYCSTPPPSRASPHVRPSIPSIPSI